MRWKPWNDSKKKSLIKFCLIIPVRKRKLSPFSWIEVNCFKTLVPLRGDSLLLTFSLIMLKNGQTCFKNLAVFTPQDFKSMSDHFSTLWMKGLATSSQKILVLIWSTREDGRLRWPWSDPVVFNLGTLDKESSTPTRLM